MTHLLRVSTVIACLGVMPGVPSAETTLKFAGQVRTRFECDGRSFGLRPTSSYTDMRTRLGVTAILDSTISAFVQLQDSRRFGASATDRPGASTTTSIANVDLHQAYFTVDDFLVSGLRLQAGRFEVSLGNERVIGAADWNNVARAFEGADLTYHAGNAVARFLALQPIELTGGKLTEEYRIYGINVAFTKARLELLGLYEDDSDPSYTEHDRMARISLGAYYNRTLGRADVTANGVYQFGDVRWAASQRLSHDISAYLLAAECGYSFPATVKPRLAVAIDYTSGDADTTIGDMTAYDNLYYSGHKFRGFMDYFLSSNVENFRGLVDLMFRAKMEPAPGWTLRGDVHRFTTAVESGETLGWEIDLTAAAVDF